MISSAERSILRLVCCIIGAEHLREQYGWFHRLVLILLPQDLQGTRVRRLLFSDAI